MSCIDCHKCQDYHDETASDLQDVGMAAKYLREGRLILALEELDLHLLRLNKRHHRVSGRYEEKV